MLPLLVMPALVVVISAEVLVLVLDVAELVVCVVQFPFGPHFHAHRPVHPVNRASDMFKVVVVAETVATDSMTKSKAIMALKRCAGASRARPVILPVGTRNAAVGECNWLGANQTKLNMHYATKTALGENSSASTLYAPALRTETPPD